MCLQEFNELKKLKKYFIGRFTASNKFDEFIAYDGDVNNDSFKEVRLYKEAITNMQKLIDHLKDDVEKEEQLLMNNEENNYRQYQNDIDNEDFVW